LPGGKFNDRIGLLSLTINDPYSAYTLALITYPLDAYEKHYLQLGLKPAKLEWRPTR